MDKQRYTHTPKDTMNRNFLNLLVEETGLLELFGNRDLLLEWNLPIIGTLKIDWLLICLTLSKVLPKNWAMDLLNHCLEFFST